MTLHEVEDMTALIGLYLKYAVRGLNSSSCWIRHWSLWCEASEVAEEEPVLEVAIADVLMLTQRFEEPKSGFPDSRILIPLYWLGRS